MYAVNIKRVRHRDRTRLGGFAGCIQSSLLLGICAPILDVLGGGDAAVLHLGVSGEEALSSGDSPPAGAGGAAYGPSYRAPYRGAVSGADGDGGIAPTGAAPTSRA